MSKRILFVVHRYAPYPGGSENYVRDMAEETLSRGHTVAVFAGEHKGDINGVRVSSDTQILLEQWDLIVVHGGNVPLQDFVLSNCTKIPSPILFLLVMPSDTPVYQFAIEHVKYIGCDTKEDWDSIKSDLSHFRKGVKIRHGIDPSISTGKHGFRAKYGIDTPYMFISCGGYWPNKAMPELVSSFNQVGREDITLVLTGYDNRYGIMPPSSPYVKTLMIDDREDVMSGILEADLYIMNSFTEGYGLVLLESMLNKTPWAARRIAGANQLSEFGFTYDNEHQLVEYMKSFNGVPDKQVKDAYEIVTCNHTIKNVVDDLLKVVA
jgi:glycosyltransferase involved in cell wall biosynthesis